MTVYLGNKKDHKGFPWWTGKVGHSERPGLARPKEWGLDLSTVVVLDEGTSHQEAGLRGFFWDRLRQPQSDWLVDALTPGDIAAALRFVDFSEERIVTAFGEQAARAIEIGTSPHIHEGVRSRLADFKLPRKWYDDAHRYAALWRWLPKHLRQEWWNDWSGLMEYRERDLDRPEGWIDDFDAIDRLAFLGLVIRMESIWDLINEIQSEEFEERNAA